MIYYVYRSLSKQKTGKGKISFATFQHFNIFASGSGPFFNYYMVPFLIIIYNHPNDAVPVYWWQAYALYLYGSRKTIFPWSVVLC